MHDAQINALYSLHSEKSVGDLIQILYQVVLNFPKEKPSEGVVE
jgi:hypothetical protein